MIVPSGPTFKAERLRPARSYCKSSLPELRAEVRSSAELGGRFRGCRTRAVMVQALFEVGMDLDEALNQFDRAEANLNKLEALWDKLSALIPQGIVFGGPEDREYRELRRGYANVLKGLPPIDGWSITANPLELAEIAQSRLDAAELGEIEISISLERGINEPELQIDEYRSRLQRKRRELVRARLTELVSEVDALVQTCAEPILSRDDYSSVRDENWETLEGLISEIDRLFGSKTRSPAWGNLRRHLGFAKGCDALDIREQDWPAIKREIEELVFDDTEPIPISVPDLGVLAASRPAGPVSTTLKWDVLNDEDFERLILAVISDARGYENPEWLMKTRAADRGRDLSCVRVRSDDLSGVIRERVIIQARHWLSQSVKDTDIGDVVTKMAHWEPPPIDVLVIATSGRFTADAVRWIEQHNHGGKRPKIELWPESALERQLAARPYLVAAFELR